MKLCFRGNLILVIIASYTLILELVNRSPFVLNDCAVIAKKYGFKLNLGKKGLGYFSLELKFWHPRSEMSLGPYFLLLHFFSAIDSCFFICFCCWSTITALFFYVLVKVKVTKNYICRFLCAWSCGAGGQRTHRSRKREARRSLFIFFQSILHGDKKKFSPPMDQKYSILLCNNHKRIQIA